ncbi:VOC family protein [Halovivax limisalsi]|uniref:VOC family protein n=1 Tax=Halovivax limisalsi TaxID=1453760 RepID=UPI001FFDD08B|nr:VOC family protein [Halovivax limisalsi]
MTRTPPTALPPETRIGRTALAVADREEMTAFYRDVVGLDVLDRADDSATLGTANAPLLVLDATDAPDRRPETAGLFHTAFRVPTRAALGDALGRLRADRHLSGASDHGVSEALYTTDPEGNGVEIYRDFPREAWPRTDDGRVGIYTKPLDLDPIVAASTGEAGAPPETDVGHVHLEVTSLERFREFYVDLLGFEVQTDLPAALFVSAGGYHHHLGANTWNGRTEPAGERGLAWFEVVLPDGESLDALRERIAESEYEETDSDAGFAVSGPDEIEARFRTEA